MTEVFIVMEGNGESYEDYQSWAVAVFSNAEDANNHAIQMQKDYDASQIRGNEEFEVFAKDSDSLYAANPYDWKDGEQHTNICDGIRDYLDNKYPDASKLDYSKHSFFVSEPVPFIK